MPKYMIDDDDAYPNLYLTVIIICGFKTIIWENYLGFPNLKHDLKAKSLMVVWIYSRISQIDKFLILSLTQGPGLWQN